MKFEEKLIKLRKQSGMSQEELAEKLNVSRQAVSRWELGMTLPDAPNLLAISDMFGVSIDYLLHDELEGNSDIPKSVEIKKENIDKNKRMGILILVGFALWVLAAVCNLANAIIRFIINDILFGVCSSVLAVMNIAVAVVFFYRYVKLVKSEKK